MTGARLRQWWSDLLSRFWLRPAVMTVTAIGLALALVRLEGRLELPSALSSWVYAGGVAGARDVLGVVASATIGVAGTTFSITVAALSLASNQMGPRLLRNFTRDPGNQYALGAFVATFAYALVVLRSVHEGDDGAFVPQFAVSAALLLAGLCVGVLVWFIHHIATSINVDRVVALVQQDLVRVLRDLPRCEQPDNVGEESGPGRGSAPTSSGAEASAGSLSAHRGGYLRVLDDDALADWAARHEACIELTVRLGEFIFPSSIVGTIRPAVLAPDAGEAVATALTIGDTRSVEQDLEYSVRQLAEVGLRALSSGINDPFTALAVLDHLGAALCEVAIRRLPDGCTWRRGTLVLRRPTTDYRGLVDSMFHMMRQAGMDQPAVMIRLLEVLGVVATVEREQRRRDVLRDHAELAYQQGRSATADRSAQEAMSARYAKVIQAVDG